MDVQIKGDKLILTLDYNKAGVASKSGKSKVHATTNGNSATAVDAGNGKKLIVGVNVYTPA